MKAYTLLLAALLAAPAGAQPLSPELLRGQRVDALARAEALGRLIPANEPRAQALTARLTAVRDALMRADAGFVELQARKAELQAVEDELTALLYQVRPRGVSTRYAAFARAQRETVDAAARRQRPATDAAYARVEAFNARLALFNSDPARAFDGIIRPATLTAQPAASVWGPALAGASPVGASAAEFRPAQAALRVSEPPAPSAPAGGEAALADLRRRLLARGISAQIIDTAIAEGRRQRVDPIIVLSVIEQESTWDRMAHNRGSGCRGLMQLAPATAEDMGVRGAVANPGLLYDVNTNIRAGVRYLNWIANSFFRMNQDLSDVSRVPRERLNQILASYNWGIGNVRNVVRRYGAAALERVAPRETRDYISEIPGRIRSWVGSFFQ
jgi:soluble lytic murein transglycosylase-like protein